MGRPFGGLAGTVSALLEQAVWLKAGFQKRLVPPSGLLEKIASKQTPNPSSSHRESLWGGRAGWGWIVVASGMTLNLPCLGKPHPHFGDHFPAPKYEKWHLAFLLSFLFMTSKTGALTGQSPYNMFP